MIPPIIAGLINYLSPILAEENSTPEFSVWDGDAPRFDADGKAVGPGNVTGSWPVVVLEMQQPGMGREHTIGANSVKDIGQISTTVYGLTREQTETVMNWIEGAFERQVNVYLNVDVGGASSAAPNFVYEMTLLTYGCFGPLQDRTSTSQYLYRGDMSWTCKVHASANTVT